MITVVDTFKTAMKANTREIRAKLILSYTIPLTLYRETIVSIDFSAQGEKSIGCVETNTIGIKLLSTALTEEQFNQEIDIEIFFGCVVNDIDTYISMGKYKSEKWLKDDYITIRCISKISDDEITSKNIVNTNISLKTYMQNTCNALYSTPFTCGNVLDSTLAKAYLYYPTKKEQLAKLAVATNGIIRYGEIKPYKIGVPVDTLYEGSNELILSTKRLSDYVFTKQTIEILKSRFIGNDATLYSGNVKLAGHEITSIVINNGCVTEVIYVKLSNEYGRFDDIKNSINECTVFISNPYPDGHDIKIEIVGEQVKSNIIGNKTNNNVTYIENPYIQNNDQLAGFDDRIYNGVTYSIPYRGAPWVQVGDTVSVKDIGNLLVTKQQLKFNGGLTGTLEGVFISG